MASVRKAWSAYSRVREKLLPRVEKFKYLTVLFMNEGRDGREIDRRIGVLDAVMRILFVVVKRDLSVKLWGTLVWKVFL